METIKIVLERRAARRFLRYWQVHLQTMSLYDLGTQVPYINFSTGDIAVSVKCL